MNPEKQCRAECKQILPLTSFGKNKKYADGKHNYCKKCCLAKVRMSRQGLLPPRKHPRKPKSELPLLTGIPEDVVFDLIRKGARTQQEISRKMRLPIDEVDGIIAELILDRKTVIARAVGWERREYFPRKVAA